MITRSTVGNVTIYCMVSVRQTLQCYSRTFTLDSSISTGGLPIELTSGSLGCRLVILYNCTWQTIQIYEGTQIFVELRATERDRVTFQLRLHREYRLSGPILLLLWCEQFSTWAILWSLVLEIASRYMTAWRCNRRNRDCKGLDNLVISLHAANTFAPLILKSYCLQICLPWCAHKISAVQRYSEKYLH